MVQIFAQAKINFFFFSPSCLYSSFYVLNVLWFEIILFFYL